jgi:hypothetical protein
MIVLRSRYTSGVRGRISFAQTKFSVIGAFNATVTIRTFHQGGSSIPGAADTIGRRAGGFTIQQEPCDRDGSQQVVAGWC